MLVLEHFCRAEASEVIISRGELLQIGGGFRIPEILEARGARLREVGTTNQTSVSDYARAITRNTALILKVHRSNFFMDGFVDSPSTEELAALARKKRVPFVEDLGSGAIVQTQSRRGRGARADAGRSREARRRSRVFQRRQIVRRSAGRHHRGPQADDRRAQAGAALPCAAVRQADPLGTRVHGRMRTCAATRGYPSSR